MGHCFSYEEVVSKKSKKKKKKKNFFFFFFFLFFFYFSLFVKRDMELGKKVAVFDWEWG